MKFTNGKQCAMALAMAVCMLGTAEAKKKPADLSAFAGTYAAQPTTIVYAGTPYSASASVIVKVPKSGKTASISISGTISSGGISVPFSNTFFLSHGTISIQDVLYLVGGSPTGGASGHYSLNRTGNQISYNVVFAPAPGIPMGGTMSVVPQGKKKKRITVGFEINSGGTIYSFPVVGLAKVPKPKKD
jgi:hypothetical protein